MEYLSHFLWQLFRSSCENTATDTQKGIPIAWFGIGYPGMAESISPTMRESNGCFLQEERGPRISGAARVHSRDRTARKKLLVLALSVLPIRRLILSGL